jgi:hypothetical protein
MACRPCQKRRMPGATRHKSLVIGTPDNNVQYVVLVSGDRWNFDQGDKIFVSGSGVQELLDDGTLRLV